MLNEYKRNRAHHKGFTLLDGDLLDALIVSGYRCMYCNRSISSSNASLAPKGTSCGCHLVAEFLEKNRLTNPEKHVP